MDPNMMPHSRGAAKSVYEIDGCDFATLEEFFDAVSRVLIPGAEWGHNLDGAEKSQEVPGTFPGSPSISNR